MDDTRKRIEADPEANRTRVKAWQKANPEKHAAKSTAHYRAKKYGITVEQLEWLHTTQEGKCAACLQPFAKTYNVDHCHTTGKVRGLLCNPCNLALGLVKDSPRTLKRMIIYLEKS